MPKLFFSHLHSIIYFEHTSLHLHVHSFFIEYKFFRRFRIERIRV